MCPIIDTTLFKAIKQKHPEWGIDDLCYQLAEAARTTHVNFSKASVDEAFTWRLTPQRGQYWSRIYDGVL